MNNTTKSILTIAVITMTGLGIAAPNWKLSQWLSVKDAPIHNEKRDGKQRAAPGTSWFASRPINAKALQRAIWTTTSLGVYEIYANGRRVGNDVLKPGDTDCRKTRRSFAYDITDLLDCAAGATNCLAAEVGSGWWRDHIVRGRGDGKKSAFRGVLEVTYADGSKATFGTNDRDWRCAIAGPLKHSGIYDGEIYDARIAAPLLGEGLTATPEINREFKGEILPTDGAEVTYREDLAMTPVEAYCWRGRKNYNYNDHGVVVKTRVFRPGEPMVIAKGEQLVVDFGQNCAAVPDLRFEAAAGTELLILPGEAVNEANGEVSRYNDGPAGSVYRQNLRMSKDHASVKYTFAGRGIESYRSRFSFFGYRYVSISATDTVRIHSLRSVPVTSITKAMEIGQIETGDKAVNRLIANSRWGQLSNYLSIPTDCPQRNERWGWTADTQVFCEAGTFFANTSSFFHKWMRDVRDCQYKNGCYAAMAPNDMCSTPRLGWSDAGIIVPYQIWKQFGDRDIVNRHWESMERYVALITQQKFESAAIGRGNPQNVYQWADWLSCEKYECFFGRGFVKGKDGKRVFYPETIRYWDYLGGCYWLLDARMMAAMASDTGHDAAKYERIAADAKAHLKAKFFAAEDGAIDEIFRDMQTPNLFALYLGLVDGRAKAVTLAALRKNFAAHGNCLQTGFLGTAILLDALADNGAVDLAYEVFLQHGYPSWLYSVDQGATTMWERWNSYTKKDGFGTPWMNSFNHYAYGSVVAWIYKTVAGIAADPAQPGFRRVIMKPRPDRRLGYVKASYRSAAGLIKSEWSYSGNKWIWNFTIPAGATALVTLPDGTAAREYPAGDHRVEL